MEDTPTPWLIADAIASSAFPALWAWAGVLLGSAVVLLGALLVCW